MATVKKIKKAQGEETIRGSRKGLGEFKTVKERTTVGGVAKPYKYTRTSIDTAGYSKGKPTYNVKTQSGEGDKTGSTVKSKSSKKITRKEVPETLKSLKMKNGGSSPAWQRKEGKNPEGGLNAKGRASYNRANPGKPGLKAPQPEGGSRKKSFCARMSGMKKKLTSAKTANDPNSRINKSLRKWKC
jgi:hypothetical protein